MTEPLKFRGAISIGRDSRNMISIQIDDSRQDSGTRVLDLLLTPEQWGNAISNLGDVPCDGTLYPCKYVGMQAENKTVDVPLPHTGRGYFERKKPEETRAALAPYEIDGWKGVDSDALNPHNWGSGKVSVHFFRYVAREAS